MDKKCIFEDKLCTDCGQCDDICDLDPNKFCDSCGECIELEGDFTEIKITKIIKEEK